MAAFSGRVLEIKRQKLNNPELELSDTQRYNICLTYIEDALLSNSKSLKNIVNMPFPDAQFTMENYNRLIYDELKYNIPDLINQHKALYGSLTLEQKGKTFLYKTLTAALTSKGEIVLNVASSGIDALLLDGGRTTHSRFAIPINIVEDSLCTISADSDLADLIRETKLIIWDEAPMVNRHCFEAFDRTLRDIATGTYNSFSDKVFGVKVIVFGGDFCQILPVIPNGTRQDVVHASLNKSYLWDHCTILSIGDGKIGGQNDGHAEVEFPKDMLLPDSDDHIETIIQETYENWQQQLWDPTYFQDRDILAPTHEEVNKVNARMMSKLLDTFPYVIDHQSDNSAGMDKSFEDNVLETPALTIGTSHLIKEIKLQGKECLLVKEGDHMFMLMQFGESILHRDEKAKTIIWGRVSYSLKGLRDVGNDLHNVGGTSTGSSTKWSLSSILVTFQRESNADSSDKDTSSDMTM
ncbi:ATP-dependent DNA helicase PIF1-like protein [Tanacetum coccineum]